MTIFTPISSSPFGMVMGHPFVSPAYTNLITRLGSHGTFTRGSTATMWSNGKLVSAGVNIARFDTDPITRELKGLLIEEARTNLQADSTTDNGWSTNGVTKTDNVLVSPDGGTNATQLDMTTSSSSGIYDFVAVTASTTYTLSYFVKHISGGTTIDINSDTASVWGASNVYKAIFDTATQVFSSVGTAVTDYGYETLPNGWYRIWITGATIVGATASAAITIYNGGATIRSFGVWGVQFEAGAFPTSLIPTAGATATRAADIATVPVTAFDFNPLQGTIYADWKRLDGVSGQFNHVVDINDGTVNEVIRILQGTATTNLAIDIKDGGVTQLGYGATIGANVQTKATLAYELNNSATSVNGGTAVLDVTCTMPTVTTVNIGKKISGNQLNGHIKELRYYPTRLANGQLESMTV